MPADTLLWWKGSAVPATTTRPSILLAPVNELPVLSSPMGEESDTAQQQLWSITVGTAAAGAWTIGALGQTAAPFVAGALDTATTIRDGLKAALDALALPLATSATGAAEMGVLGDAAGVSLGVTLTIELPTGGGLQPPLDEDKPSPPMTMQQDGYSMVLTLAIPAGTRLSLWRGADDDVVL